MTKSKKARPLQSISVFLLGVFAFLGFRWAVYEPYVIPSGSMIPSLLIYDHILVSKFDFGLRYPFSTKWMFGPSLPKRGDIVVFQSVEEDIVMIKRVIGLPGDIVEVKSDGLLTINSKPVEYKSITAKEVEEQYKQQLDCVDCYEFYQEKVGEHSHLMQLEKDENRFTEGVYEVPQGNLFVLGDNRDRSRDSRYWGFLPLENLIGEAKWIWLSCDLAVSKAPVLCHPAHIRWHRLFSAIQ